MFQSVDLLFNTCLFQGTDVLEKVGGLHNFMNWKRAMLTVGVINHCCNFVLRKHRPTISLFVGQWWLSNGFTIKTVRSR